MRRCRGPRRRRQRVLGKDVERQNVERDEHECRARRQPVRLARELAADPRRDDVERAERVEAAVLDVGARLREESSPERHRRKPALELVEIGAYLVSHT
jgi:hypothetical protein